MAISRNALIFSIIIILFTSCATSYKAIIPDSVNFPAAENGSNFSYRFDVLREAGNRKLAKKEERKLVRVVAVKLVNNTGQTLKYGYNYKIYSENAEIEVLSATRTTSYIRQSVPSYLLYLALTPAKLTFTSGYKQSSFPLGFILGPGLAGINMAISGTANKNLRTELENNTIIDKEIKPGETFYGLIGIYDNHFMPLTIKIAN